jgi:hypothetical protein
VDHKGREVIKEFLEASDLIFKVLSGFIWIQNDPSMSLENGLRVHKSLKIRTSKAS